VISEGSCDTEDWSNQINTAFSYLFLKHFINNGLKPKLLNVYLYNTHVQKSQCCCFFPSELDTVHWNRHVLTQEVCFSSINSQ